MRRQAGDGTQLAGDQGSGGTTPRRPALPTLLRDLALAVAVLAVGVFVTGSWLRHPEGHTVRRLVTGVLALLVGGAGVVLAFLRRPAESDRVSSGADRGQA